MPLKFFSTKHADRSTNQLTFIGCSIAFLGLLILAGGCDLLFPENTRSNPVITKKQQKFVSVDVAIAQAVSLKKDIEYVGTTFPVQEVSLRSRVEGQILNIAVDVGDRVEQNQVLVQIDDSITEATVLEAKAEVTALQSEVVSLEADVNEGLTQIKQAEIELKQAQSDLVRINKLFQEGAVSQQEAELAQNTVDNAEQVLQSNQQQLKNRSSAVTSAKLRVVAQQALVAQEIQRQLFTLLTSPVAGSVLERVLEPGDLAQVGSEVLRLGDFSQIQIRVEISELELAGVQLGQQARVRLDALPEKTFMGEVTQISLVADSTARLIPVEITIPNSDRLIGSGLLARVNFNPQNKLNIVVPETAVEVTASQDTATMFVVQREGENTRVTAREVKLGDLADFEVEILSGLKPGEEYVVHSSENLGDGDTVNLSFLSESSSPDL